MSMPIAMTGGGAVRILPGRQKNGEQNRADAVREQAIERFTASLPGNKSPERNTEAAIAHLEKINLAFNKRLQFVVNHESNQITVKVIDTNTDKVIKVLPPAELQRLADAEPEMVGSLLNETA